MPIDLNDAVTRSVNLTNSAGVAVDADGAVTYTVTLPDGTAGVTPTVQHGGTGEYYVVYPTLWEGLHREVFSASVGGVPVNVRRNFIVESASDGFLDTDEVITLLKGEGIIVGPADLEWLRWLCMVACDAVELQLNRVIGRRTITVTLDGGRAGIVLPYSPVIAVSSVAESGTMLAATDYTFDPASGILYRGGQQAVSSWASGRQNLTVTLVAGYLNPPRVARMVAATIVARQWQSTRQMPHPAMDDVDAALAAVAAQSRTPGEIYGSYRSLYQLAIA
jgi:hypothetical protein